MISINLNAGTTDRIARSVSGALIIAAGFGVGEIPGCALGIIGLISLITGLVGWCPLYAIFKIDTCNLSKKGTRPAF